MSTKLINSMAGINIENDSIDKYFECITACSLDDDGFNCLTKCMDIHLKKEAG